MPKSAKRKRGIILTSTGWQKLQDAKLKSELEENFGDKYTLEELSERARLDSSTVIKVLNREEKVDKRTIELLFDAFNLELDKSCYSHQDSNTRQDWGEAISVSAFYGRTEELDTLEQWVVGGPEGEAASQRCRLIALLGMGGIGKTALAIKFAERVQDKFEFTIWRSLRDAPSVEVTLISLIQFLSDEPVLDVDLPQDLGDRITQLIEYLRKHRCLLIFDNAESILRSGSRAGAYLEGYEGYGELLRQVGEAAHQSCLVLTSREKPKDVASLEGKLLPVRSLPLSGLKELEGRELFKVKGLTGTESELSALVKCYAGNALAIKIIATNIQNIFDGSISEFFQQGIAVFGDIRDLLDQQFERLSDREKEIMYWFAINREPLSLSDLREDLVLPAPQQKLLEAIESLGRRSLIERRAAQFSLQTVVLEYVTQRVIEQVCTEIVDQDIRIFNSHALIKAEEKDYIRESQLRLILKPVLDELLTVFRSKKRLQDWLTKILAMLQETAVLEPGYAAGNVFNLLCQLECDLSGYDFSYLAVWQADMRHVNLRDVNFTNANLAKSVFAETFGGILVVAFSPDSSLLATGDSTGEVRLCQATDGKRLITCKGHTSWVVSVAFSSDGRTLASSSTDYTVKLWDTSTGQCLQTLQDHHKGVWSIAFSPDDRLLASGSDDHTIRVWDVKTGECLKTLHGHTSWVRSIAFSSDATLLVSGSDDHTIRVWDVKRGQVLSTLQGHDGGIHAIALSPSQILASGSEDHTIRLWNIETGECLKTLEGHSNGVWSVAFSCNGETLVSGSWDRTVRLWNVGTGEELKTLQGHTNRVFSVAFCPQGNRLVSGSDDQTVRLWSVSTGQVLKILQGRTNRVFSVAFSPDATLLASGSDDHMVRLWDVETGRCLKTLQGHTNWVYSIAFSPDGQLLASSSEDRTVRLWDIKTGQCIKTLKGHQDGIWSIAFSPDGQLLASSSEDHTVRLWEVSTGQCLKILQGHANGVWSVAFSPDGETLASGSEDHTVRVWSVSTGEMLRTLQGHTSWVWSVAFSPNGETLVSGSVDHTLKIWSVSTGETLRTLQGHTSWVRSVAFSPDGHTLASSSHDHSLRLWDVATGEQLKTLHGHTSWVWSTAFSPDSKWLVSSGEDETIKLWDVRTGNCLRTLRAEKPYERMNINGATGLNEATIATLKALGAVDGISSPERVVLPFQQKERLMRPYS